MEEMGKTVRKIEHHWLGQADVELQIGLLFLQKKEKVYFKSQILVHEYWTILDHFCVPVL